MSNHEETEKKPIYKKWWFWLIAIIVIIGIAGSGEKSSNNQQTAQTTQTSSVAQNEENKVEEKTEYNQGEEAILGNGAITVTKVEKSNGSEYDKPKAGKEYVIVHLTIENKGEKNLSYNPYYFKMQNSQGQQENETFTIIDQDTSLQSGELVAGGKVSGTIVFEEPKDDTGLTLIYSDSIWSSKELKIKL